MKKLDFTKIKARMLVAQSFVAKQAKALILRIKASKPFLQRLAKSAKPKQKISIKAGFNKLSDAVGSPTGLLVMGVLSLFGFIRTVNHFGNLERGLTPVVYQEKDSRILVYPTRDKVYLETDKHFKSYDYSRKYMCQGVLSTWPTWATGAGNEIQHSMTMCRSFGEAADAPELELKRAEMELYLVKAKASISRIS
jgi:hypothetical protein